MGMRLEEAAAGVAAVEGVLVPGAGLDSECEWCGLGVGELWAVDVSGLAEVVVRFREAISRLVKRGLGRMMAIHCQRMQQRQDVRSQIHCNIK